MQANFYCILVSTPQFNGFFSLTISRNDIGKKIIIHYISKAMRYMIIRIYCGRKIRKIILYSA